jgi:disulfide oxidoreductase YuzD
MFLRKGYLFYLVIFCVLILGLLSSVNAFTIQDLDKNTVTYINGKSVISTSIVSDNAYSEFNMKKELNNISKIVVKVNGKIVNTIKKDKGWNRYKYYPKVIIDSKTVVNGNIKGKKVSILIYDKNNKLIKSKSNMVKSANYLTTAIKKSKNPKFARLTYNQAYKSVKKDLLPNLSLKYVGYFYYKGELQWNFIAISTKTGEGVDFALSDKDETLGVY